MVADKVWTLKYSPDSPAKVVGQEGPVKQISSFVDGFKNSRKKSVLLYGSSGCGKTSAVYAIARQTSLEVFELNASDFRNKDSIQTLLGSVSKQMSLFAKGKIILIDELDGVSGTKDRGGIPTLAKLVKESAFPIIMIANNPFEKKFAPLRKIASMIQFNELSTSAVADMLLRVADSEKLEYEEDAIRAIARRSGGDVRGAINDLQMIAMMNKSVKREDLEVLSEREQKDEMESSLRRVFKTTDPNLAIGAFDRVGEDLPKCLMWVDENLPKEYEKPADLVRAYYYLSRADIMNSRIRRWQHWRFLVYLNAFITAGVAVSKDDKYRKMINYKQSGRPLKIYLANMKYNKRKAIAEKIALVTHTSAKVALRDTLPYVQRMMKNSVMSEHLAEQFELDVDEVSWLKR